jgi:hypothetical protein
LSKQIRKHAQDASQNKGNSQFTKLYSIAQAPTVNKKIEFILARTDIGEAQKVEFIASLLRIKSSEQEAAAKSSSSGI